jgi:sialate O-acetylesterase
VENASSERTFANGNSEELTMNHQFRPMAQHRISSKWPAASVIGAVIAGICAAFTFAVVARADVKLPKIFSNHMVLQCDTPANLWGWAEAGEEVTAALAGKSKTTKAGADGKWRVQLDKLAAGGPHTLTVKGKNTLTVNDVLVGEVWLASGQSNMAMTVSGSRNASEERATAKHPNIRMFTVARNPAREPRSDCGGSWVVCSPETVGAFSATAYFFGRDLHMKLAVPVGLINSSVGGTPIEAWTSLEGQKSKTELNELLASWDQRAARYDPAKAKEVYEKQLAAWKVAAQKARAERKPVPRAPRRPVDPRDESHHPAVLYNGMIAPLIPYTLRGAIWYQGESNANSDKSGKLYALQLPLLVHDWRTRWGQGDFPFAWVQLPNYQTGAQGWPLVREAMLQTLSVPKTGMAIAIDVGEAKDIHPKNKQEVGRRLALWARAKVYGETIPWSGPLPAGHKVQNGTVELSFKHTDGGLVAKGGELSGFTIAGADKKWRPAVARIQGDKVLVSSPDVKNPVAVRYDWANNPDGNLYNKAGLPSSPFRTDKD